MSRVVLAVVVSSLLVGKSFADAAASRSSATTQSSATASNARIALWFTQLADADESVRAQARINLMGLSRQDLPELRNAVQQSLPLEPTQMATLKDIVLHVHIASESYPVMPEQGFLGVKGERLDSTELSEYGMRISELIMGFCAYPVLQVNDVIFRVAEHPNAAVRDARHLSELLQREAGKVVHLDLYRSGQVIRVPIKVSHKPLAAETEVELTELVAHWKASAETYWNQTFAPLLRESVSGERSDEFNNAAVSDNL